MCPCVSECVVPSVEAPGFFSNKMTKNPQNILVWQTFKNVIISFREVCFNLSSKPIPTPAPLCSFKSFFLEIWHRNQVKSLNQTNLLNQQGSRRGRRCAVKEIKKKIKALDYNSPFLTERGGGTSHCKKRNESEIKSTWKSEERAPSLNAACARQTHHFV